MSSPLTPTVLLSRRSDEDLVAAVRDGSSHAAEALVARYEAQLTGYARSLLGGAHHDAEEAVQVALLRALASLRRDTGRAIALKPWLYAITRNGCIDRLRRGGRDRGSVELGKVEALLADAGDTDPHAALLRREEVAATVTALRGLPRRQREALVGHELEGRSHQELADRLDVSVGATKALVCRARASLQPRRAAA
jgi:RNA polymerase sigma-70 factor (ECF subfamily)